MTATPMLGRPVADRVQEQVAKDVAELGHVGLATILVGDDPASHVYVGHKHKAASAVGIETRDLRLPAETTQDEVLAAVAELNADDGIDGLLVQLPLPGHMDEAVVATAIDPAKDVDGLTPTNAGLLYLGRPALVPATPLGIVELLDEHGVELKGAEAVVVGRSDIVGKPIAHLLLQRHATVTICHSRTRDLQLHTSAADVLVVASGIPGLVTREMVKRGAAVVDVGITRTEAGLVGDVDPGVAEIAG
ncbi:MAG TPA: bifunctional 5,10-methylenetetrahydrofolate dehydrogenase/5,10-methenyltetrahydrofolate cyclohydrolase, partial [Actinomycetota bacterium]